jgi:hypothetical protein
MVRVLSVAILSVAFSSSPIRQQTSPLAGEWTGKFKTGETEGDLIVKVGNANGGRASGKSIDAMRQ